MKKIIIVVSGLIVNKDKKFLLTKRVDKNSHNNNKWQIPGGGLEFGEKPEKTLKREIKEELGVEIKIIKLIPKIFSENFGDYQLIFINYLCQLKNEKSTIALNEEASEYGWFTPQQAENLVCLTKVKEIIRLAYQML